MLEACTKYLKLSIISRIGFRDVKTIKFPSNEDAVASLRLLIPERISKTIDDPTKARSFNMGIRRETEAYGLLSSIRAEEREFPKPPFLGRFPIELHSK